MEKINEIIVSINADVNMISILKHRQAVYMTEYIKYIQEEGDLMHSINEKQFIFRNEIFELMLHKSCWKFAKILKKLEDC